MAPTVNVGNAQGSTDADDNRPLVISLSVALPVVGIALIVALITWYRIRRRRRSDRGFFSRNTSPIDDDEIESWKSSHINEKKVAAAAAADNATTWTYTDDSNSITKGETAEDGREASGPMPLSHAIPIQTATTTTPITHYASNGSIRKPPTLIVYQNPRASEDDYSPSSSPAPHSASAWSPSYKHSIDIVQTPVLARAPNARPGLTDESIRGDVPYVVPSSHNHHRRQSSRLMKHSPRSPKHQRSRSSRSSASAGSLHQWYGHPSCGSNSPMMPRISADGTHVYAYAASPTSPRSSVDNFFNFHQPSPPTVPSHHHGQYRHQRANSASADVQQRPSLDTDFAFDHSQPTGVRLEDIGRAIG
jgi:hypothetical protein